MLDLETDERTVFCQRGEVPGWERIMHFYVNPRGLSFGERALSAAALQEGGVVVIDEIGPFELQGKGWATPFEQLLGAKNQHLVFSVRKSLVSDVTGHWQIGNALVLDIEDHAPEDCVRIILEGIA